MSDNGTNATTEEVARPKRLTLSQILELVLTRGSREYSGVTLTRNAAGETQIEVKVRTGDDEGVMTVEDAEAKASDVYARLRETYPARDGHDEAAITLSRNAKGETQIEVKLPTSESTPGIEAAEEKANAVYQRMRGRYPMRDGTTGAPIIEPSA